MILSHRWWFYLIDKSFHWFKIFPQDIYNGQILRYVRVCNRFAKESFFQGVVRIFVIGARDLIKADINLLGRGKSDPFVRVTGKWPVEDVLLHTAKRFFVVIQHKEMSNIKRRQLIIPLIPNGMKYVRECDDWKKKDILFRFLNSLLNNTKVIMSNLKSMMKIQAKMISSDGKSIQWSLSIDILHLILLLLFFLWRAQFPLNSLIEKDVIDTVLSFSFVFILVSFEIF